MDKFEEPLRIDARVYTEDEDDHVIRPTTISGIRKDDDVWLYYLEKHKELRLEEIYNIGYRNKRSRYMSHFMNTIIRDKVERLSEQSGVRFVQQDSTYRSQRCSDCGVVRKANRKGKVYTCKHCGLIIDADFNASKNHEIDLPEVPYTLRKKKLNRGNGFLWNPNGFFDFLTGTSLESVPPVEDLCNKCI